MTSIYNRQGPDGMQKPCRIETAGLWSFCGDDETSTVFIYFKLTDFFYLSYTMLALSIKQS
jgi:hypothetical protein